MPFFGADSVSASLARLLSQDCTLCGVRSQESLCAACFGDLPYRSVTGCPQCDAEGTPRQLCGACLSAPPHFDETICAFRYAYPLDRLVQAYKFNANLNLLPLFADALARAIKSRTTQPSPDIIIPLPLGSKRLRERGFNQSSLLAQHVAKTLGIPFDARGMLRVRETPPQSGLSRVARLKNVRGAFDCAHRLDGKRVALVDDVMTTGATLSEAAKTLKKAGAAHVSAWVIARGTQFNASSALGTETVPFDDTQK